MPVSKTLIFLPLLLTVGVVWSKKFSLEEDENSFQPFLLNSQKKRICVELCLTGLGGPPCGLDCSDIMPQNFPIQSSDNTNNSAQSDKTHVTRSSSCNVLCKNSLGVPLCACDNTKYDMEKDQLQVDFVEICSDFCVRYNHQLPGCQKCSIYEALFPPENDAFSQQSLMKNTYDNIDWYAWCQSMCGKGDGGAACNCDRLPL